MCRASRAPPPEHVTGTGTARGLIPTVLAQRTPQDQPSLPPEHTSKTVRTQRVIFKVQDDPPGRKAAPPLLDHGAPPLLDHGAQHHQIGKGGDLRGSKAPRGDCTLAGEGWWRRVGDETAQTPARAGGGASAGCATHPNILGSGLPGDLGPARGACARSGRRRTPHNGLFGSGSVFS